MDAYGLNDLLLLFFVVVSLIITRGKETLYLAVFWLISSVSAFFIFYSEFYIIWPAVFTGLCLLFGSLTQSRGVILGYIGILISLGLNESLDYYHYSQTIVTLFLIQIMMAANHDINTRINGRILPNFKILLFKKEAKH